MGKNQLNRDCEFVVGEEKVLDFILAFLFFTLFLYGLIDTIMQKFSNLNYLNFVFLLALLPALFFFKKGKSRRVYIRVNISGIYQDEKLVTGWSNLLNAYIIQKEKVFSIQDNFILVVEYLKDGAVKGSRRKIPLTNTQNKSEEEILEAVKFFWNEFKIQAGR